MTNVENLKLDGLGKVLEKLTDFGFNGNTKVCYRTYKLFKWVREETIQLIRFREKLQQKYFVHDEAGGVLINEDKTPVTHDGMNIQDFYRELNELLLTTVECPYDPYIPLESLDGSNLTISEIECLYDLILE